MDDLIREFLGLEYSDGDEIENSVFKRLGELAADDDEVLDQMDAYFRECNGG